MDLLKMTDQRENLQTYVIILYLNLKGEGI